MLEAVSLSPVEFTATMAFLANALEASPTGTTASHRDTLEIIHTTATARARNGSAITPTTVTGRHRSGAAILPILVTAPGANGSSINCVATDRVGLLRSDRESCMPGMQKPASEGDLEGGFPLIRRRWSSAV